ncbi:hypothetical protein [Nocardia abscessus]|uniref:hypothetical protein n=1 Tax=Nocardia abscessus TaxID=120957 RepID=UPI001D13E24B|nr:hypothetical protein [Nocardia abscessus]MCC3333627.1 hypothetical protein [Nocardia abscessus]
MARLRAVVRKALLGDDALRLRFEFSDGRFWQWVSDELPEVELVDLSAGRPTQPPRAGTG